MRMIIVLAFVSQLCASPLLHAAEAYPSQPITIVVPFAEGSDSDRFAQSFTRHMKKHLAHSDFRLLYRPGESGAVAALSVSAAPADGYTLLLGRAGTQIIAPALNPKLSYRWDSFTNLAILEIIPMICAVRDDAPYENARELLAAIRSQPGKLKYGSSGKNTILNFTAQYMLYLSGLKADAAKEVVYPTGPAVTQALLDEQIDFSCNNALSQIPHIQSGRIRGLLTTASGRLPALPSLPNAREAGLRDMGQITAWTALIAPPKLPEEIVNTWQQALRKLETDPEWAQESLKQGAIPALEAIPDPNQFMRKQARLYEQLIQTQGIQP